MKQKAEDSTKQTAEQAEQWPARREKLLAELANVINEQRRKHQPTLPSHVDRITRVSDQKLPANVDLLFDAEVDSLLSTLLSEEENK